MRYRVDLTEEEARVIGFVRYKTKERKNRCFLGMGISLGVLALCGVLAILYEDKISDLAFIVPILIAAASIGYFPYRLDYLASKAGKEFVQSLKKES